MRRNVNVYINGEKLDLFDFEDINITDSIKDVKDISKLFTSFSKEFTVPASKNNNRIFKHYYNYNITQGFDARIKNSSQITIDGIDYLLGNMTMVDVTLKNNIPYAYKVVFFGNTITLKDIIGDDELQNLKFTDYMSQFSLNYTYTNIYNLMRNGYNLNGSGGLTLNLNSDAGDVCVPFIASKHYYFYDSNPAGTNPSNGGSQSRNVLTTATTTPRGVLYSDVKPAIRLYHIVKAIEEKYGLTFSDDVFSENVDWFYNAYMWLSKESGLMTEQIETSESDDVTYDLFSFSSGTVDYRDVGASGNNDTFELRQSLTFTQTISNRYIFDFNVTPVGGGIYTIKVFNELTDSVVHEVSGSGVINVYFQKDIINDEKFKPIIKVYTNGGAITSFTLSNISVKLLYQVWFGYEIGDTAYYTYIPSVFVSEPLSMASQLPNMKVIDFIKGLFMMFNLTAYYDENNKIVVRTLDDYYYNGREVDLTRYADTSKVNIAKSNLYSEISYEYKDAKTFAILNANEITGDDFGNETVDYTTDSISSPLAFDGGKYEVKPKFEHMMYERMSNQSNITQVTDLQWGWAVSQDETSVNLSGLVLYCIKENSPAQNINFDNGNGTYNTLTAYVRPSNSCPDTGLSLNFGSEFDEWTRETANFSLFNAFHDNYISNIYNIRSRIVKYTTYLPSHEMINLKLNDRVKVTDAHFRINKLEMNLNTGKTDLELVHDTTYEYFDLQPATIAQDSVTQTEATIEITPDLLYSNYFGLRYAIYVDDVFYGYEYYNIDNDTELPTIYGLSPTTSYNIKVVSEYLGREAESNTISITTTS